MGSQCHTPAILLPGKRKNSLIEAAVVDLFYRQNKENDMTNSESSNTDQRSCLEVMLVVDKCGGDRAKCRLSRPQH